MTAHSVEIYGDDYEHTLDISGVWSGVNLTYVTRPVLEIFGAMLSTRAYQVCEFSLSNYLMLRDRGVDWIRAVPVFPYRAFRHSTLYVRADSSLTEPAQLRGKRVGVPDFSMTAAVWTRGILRDVYCVAWQDIRWISGHKSRFDLPAEVQIERVDEDLEEALVAGRIDALLTPHVRDWLKPSAEHSLRCLISDVRQAERNYFKDTGIYPINHTVCVRSDCIAAVPNIGAAVTEAYAASKRRAYERRLGTTLVPWGNEQWDAAMEEFGGDPMPYGLIAENRTVVETLANYLVDQKLIAAMPEVDSLFIQ